MPIKRSKIHNIPVTKRKRHNVLRESDEFIQLKTMLAHGLKPSEAVQVTLPADILKKRKNAARLFKMLAVAYIKEMELPYDVRIVGLNEPSPQIWVYDRSAEVA